MDREKAIEILGGMIQSDNGLFDLGHYVGWDIGETKVTLDCKFTADELEAIAWWMKNNGK